MLYRGRTGEFFEVLDVSAENCDLLKQQEPEQLSLLWFVSNDNHLVIDAVEYQFDTNHIICLTEFHQIKPKKINRLKLLRFNRPFYCITHQDSEVGCKGILFFGSSNLPIMHLEERNLHVLNTTWEMLRLEMEARDNLQLEMLQMMLTRILILCTRIYKSQTNYNEMDRPKVDLIRAFNFLVEKYFREKHTVGEYADLLHKSPKTLSNIFKKMGGKTPLELIKDRRMLEARRLLSYTQEPIAEIGYNIGFADIQSFSRFFKKNEGISPSEFRDTYNHY